MNFDMMNHAPGAGSAARLVDLQSSAIPPCHGVNITMMGNYFCSLRITWTYEVVTATLSIFL